MRSATTPDAFTKLVNLNKARQDPQVGEAGCSGCVSHDPVDAPMKAELQDLTCDLDKLDMEICDAEEQDLVTRCQESCASGYL